MTLQHMLGACIIFLFTSETMRITPTLAITTAVTASTGSTVPTPALPPNSGCPVTFNPPSLVVRYGDSALATCSALVPTYGIGWEAFVGVTGLVEGVTALNWTVKELRDWTVSPQCFINTLDGEQCVVELPVVVYMTPQSLSITANRQGPLAEGKYYFLYCHIENITPVEHLTVTWFKGDMPIKTDNSYKSTTVGPQNITSELLVAPDTSDNGAQYKCEVELDLGPRGPPKLTSYSFTMTVYSGCPIVLRPSTLVVKYGDSASADCSTFVPHNGIGWNSALNPVGSMKSVQNVTWRVENITEWTVKPKCFIDTDDMRCHKDLHVSVYSVPDNIAITANTAGAMAEGKYYILSCHIGNIAPVQSLIVSWFKGATLLKTDNNHQSTTVGPENVTSGLMITPNTSDNGAQYRCEAELDLGPRGPPKLTSYSFTMTVYTVPDNITITANTAGAMAEGKYYILSCHIGNIAPVQNLTVSWFKGDTLLITDDSHHSTAVGPQNITSELLITPNTSDNGAQYRCETELNLGPGGPPKLTSDPFTITVYHGFA